MSVLTNSELLHFQVLTEKGWEQIYPSLPVTIADHCAVQIDESSIMIIGGIQNSTAVSTNTFILDTNFGSWVHGKN